MFLTLMGHLFHPTENAVDVGMLTVALVSYDDEYGARTGTHVFFCLEIANGIILLNDLACHLHLQTYR